MGVLAEDGRHIELAYHLGRWGVHGMLVLNQNTGAAQLRTTAEQAYVTCSLAAVAEFLPSGAPDTVRSALAIAIRWTDRCLTAERLAAACGVPEAQLRRQLHEARLPSPRRLLAWCRLLHAARLLEAGRLTTERVGMVAGYASGPAFRNACRSLLGASPQELRSHGGFRFVLQRLRAEAATSTQ